MVPLPLQMPAQRSLPSRCPRRHLRLLEKKLLLQRVLPLSLLFPQLLRPRFKHLIARARVAKSRRALTQRLLRLFALLNLTILI